MLIKPGSEMYLKEAAKRLKDNNQFRIITTIQRNSVENNTEFN